jgi:outer membrane protein OmpA-like peptidoglycan-associated protein
MNENEAPVKAKKESQRKKVLEINDFIGELSVSWSISLEGHTDETE